MSTSETFTCLTCQVSFKDCDLQRQHHKSDWHWYNLKRKVVSLPPVSPEEFKCKVLEQKQREVNSNMVHQYYCNTCKKKFNSQNTFNGHLRSKKHVQLTNPDEDGDYVTVSREGLTEKEKLRAESVEKEGTSEADMEIEEEDFEGLAVNECLFCSHWSQNMEKNLKHMTNEHSFYIPDPEYMTDVTGFLTYLGIKVGADNECIKCGEDGKEFRSIEAVQKHMVDKGHSIINTDGDAYLEYSDFYDFSTSYPDFETANSEESPETSDHKLWVDEDMCLVLPSGARVGHRSMKIYYKQNLSLEERSVRNNSARIQLLRNYKAIGWYNGQQGKMKIKDEKRNNMMKQKDKVRLAVKANKFQPHLRPQVIF
ncbi:hypothetical protein ACHWQZ_G018764 [Mnemiopsis leidyi]